MKSKLLLVVAFVLAVRVRAHAGRVPLDRDRGQGDRAQPALGRRRVRRAGARLPARLRQGTARLQRHGGIEPGGAAAAVRDPVRPLDGLPRLHPQPDPRDVRPRREHRRRDLARDQVHAPASSRAPRSSWSAVFAVFGDALDAVLQAVRRRARGGGPARRDDRPRGAPARDDEAARRVELVPAPVARVASAARGLRARSPCPTPAPELEPAPVRVGERKRVFTSRAHLRPRADRAPRARPRLPPVRSGDSAVSVPAGREGRRPHPASPATTAPRRAATPPTAGRWSCPRTEPIRSPG